MNNYVVEASIRKGVYNDWSTKVIKGHTGSVKHIYRMKEIYRGYRIVATRRARKNSSEEKSKTPKALKTKISRNKCNKKIKFCEKFGIKITKITIEALMMDIMNNNTIWVDAIT